jgi:hypothetical protein
MSESDQFRRYAEEAMRWAAESKTEIEENTLIELACMWAQAAAESAKPVAASGGRECETRGRRL